MIWLKVDLDFKDLNVVNELVERVYLIEYITGIKLHLNDVLETNKGFHLYFYSEEDLESWEVLFLQSILKDDYKRALFNFVRVRNGVKNWNVLFKRKYRFNKYGGKYLVSKEFISFKSIAFYYKWRVKTLARGIKERVKRFLRDMEKIKGVG